jgi:steroid delta-isomerase-like uncharacterized protein
MMESNKSSSNNNNAQQVVISYLKALENRDFKAARSYMHDNMSFSGPMASHHRPDALLKDLEPLCPLKYEIKKAFAVEGNENDVCLLYDLTIGTPAVTLFTCGWYRVQDGKISSIRTVFDPRPFAAAVSGSKKKLVERHYANVSEGRIERDREVMSDDIVHVSAAAGTVSGIKDFLAFVSGFKRAFPDLRFDIRASIEGADTVITEGVFIGTNTGPMAGSNGSMMPATGRKVELPFCDVWKVRNGRIVENHIYYDQLAFLGQLGLIPQQAKL